MCLRLPPGVHGQTRRGSGQGQGRRRKLGGTWDRPGGWRRQRGMAPPPAPTGPTHCWRRHHRRRQARRTAYGIGWDVDVLWPLTNSANATVRREAGAGRRPGAGGVGTRRGEARGWSGSVGPTRMVPNRCESLRAGLMTVDPGKDRGVSPDVAIPLGRPNKSAPIHRVANQRRRWILLSRLRENEPVPAFQPWQGQQGSVFML